MKINPANCFVAGVGFALWSPGCRLSRRVALDLFVLLVMTAMRYRLGDPPISDASIKPNFPCHSSVKYC